MRIEAGGALLLEAGCSLGVPGGGLLVHGELRVQGKALTHGDSDPGFRASALAESSDAALNTTARVDEVIHCPGSDDGDLWSEDCEQDARTPGLRNEVALCWPADSEVHAAWLDRVEAGDVLAFWDPTGGMEPPRDVNAFYAIERTLSTGARRCLVVDVRQGRGGAGYPPGKRDIIEVSLSADYVARGRTLQVGTEPITADKQAIARWLTCTAETRHTQKITGVDDDPQGDSVRLLPGGFPVDLPAGANCHVDYGWMPGDAVSIWRPARLADGTPDVVADSEIRCESGATCDLDFALLANRGRIFLFSSSDIDDSWIVDAAAAGDLVVLHLVDWTAANVSQRVQMTSHATPSAHSVSLDGEGFEGGTLIDWHLRHSEDDFFVPNNCVVAGGSCVPGNQTITDQTLVLRRLRAGFMGCAGGSCSIIDSNSEAGDGARAFHVDLDGLLAEDPGGEDNVSSSFYHGRGGFWTLRNMTFIGADWALVQGFGGPAASEQNIAIDNLYDIGRDSGTYGWEILDAVRNLSDASLVDTRIRSASSRLRGRWPSGARWSGILVLDPSKGLESVLGVYDASGEPTEIRDLAIVGFDGASGPGGFPFEVHAQPGEEASVRIENVTLALRPGQRSGYEGAIRYGGDDRAFDTLRSLHGLLVANFAGEPPGAAATRLEAGDLDGVSDVCLEGNEEDGAFPAEWISGTVLRNAGLRFADPEQGVLRQVPGSPGHGICGARDPGARDMWALRVLHHDPYVFGDTWKTPCPRGAAQPQNVCVDGDGCPVDCPDTDSDGVTDARDVCPGVADPAQGDRDADGRGDACDLCPDYPGGENRDSDGNGIGDPCECGDQNGDGRVSVEDLIAIWVAIFQPERVTPLCDTDADRRCTITDLVGAQRKIYGSPAYCERYPPP